MNRQKSTTPLTPAQKQAAYRERQAKLAEQDSRIASAARILHAELLMHGHESVTIPVPAPWEDTATFLRNFAADLESARRERIRKEAKKSN